MLTGGVRKEKYERIFEGDKRLVLRSISDDPKLMDFDTLYEEFGELS